MAGRCDDAGVTTPAWYPDERARAGPEHLGAHYVAEYDAKAGLDGAAELAFLRESGLGPDTTLVDLGADTGLLAVAAAPHCRRLVAVDPSPAMVAAIHARVAEAGLVDVEVVEARFLTYEHGGEAPQLVHSRNALHHLSDFWKGVELARIHDLLAPGGVLVLRDLVYTFDPAEAESRLEVWFASGTASPEEGHAGFEIDHAEHRRGTYATYVCTRR